MRPSPSIATGPSRLSRNAAPTTSAPASVVRRARSDPHRKPPDRRRPMTISDEFESR